MARRFLILTFALTLLTLGFAQTVVVYPFESSDSLLGTIVADRVATALEEEFEVYGPAVAPSLVPPLPIGSGFLNPTEFLQGRGVSNRTGAKLLRDSLGADAVLTGTIRFEGERLVARLNLATDEGVEGLLATAGEDDPGAIAERLANATAGRLGARLQGTEIEIDMSDSDDELAQALTLISAGLIEDARRILSRISDPGERVLELLAAMQAVESAGEGTDTALLATLALNRQPLDEELAQRYMVELAETSQLPAAKLWSAVLAVSLGDIDAAGERFASLPPGYEFGAVARAAFDRTVAEGDEASDAVSSAIAGDDVAALLGVAAIAGFESDVELEKQALTALTKAAPFFAYPFERLSFIAFDEEEALAAGQALAVAVELQPESDLYWTNLGWAYYLLGMLPKSEEASRRAVQLDPSQYIARYNLGLVEAATGRLAAANESYLQALRVDPEVDDAALADVEQALELYPNEPALHYVLGLLYESEGRRAEAAAQYASYLERGSDEDFLVRASDRVEVLTAPPPPIELTNGLVTITLGVDGISEAPFHPGDPVYPSFEVYTPGEELPQQLEVTLVLRDPSDREVMTVEESIDVPRSAVALVIDDIEVRLPNDLQPGIYRLDVQVSASEEREAGGTVMFEVAGESQLVRQLLGRNLRMQSLETGQRLYSAESLSQPDRLIDLLLDELATGSQVAEEALPLVEEGRFAGMSGGQVFTESTAEDVRDFIRYLVGSGARNSSFVFVEAYAQWALDGAPANTVGEPLEESPQQP